MVAQEELKGTNRRELFETNKNKFAPLFKEMQIVAKKVLTEERVELKYKNDFDAGIDQLLPDKNQPLPRFLVQAIVKVGDDWKLDGPARPNEESWENEGQIEKFAP